MSKEYDEFKTPKKIVRRVVTHSVMGWASILSGGMTLPAHAVILAKDAFDAVSTANDIKSCIKGE